MEMSPFVVVIRTSGPPALVDPVSVARFPSFCGPAWVASLRLLSMLPLVASAWIEKPTFSGSVSSIESLRSSSVMLPRVGAAVRSIVAVLVGDRDVARQAIQADVAIAGAQYHRAQHLIGGDAGAADLRLAIQADELQIGAAGVEADGAVDVLHVGRAEEFSVQVDRPGDVGEGHILARGPGW